MKRDVARDEVITLDMVNPVSGLRALPPPNDL